VKLNNPHWFVMC